jgi:hypothetical protein
MRRFETEERNEQFLREAGLRDVGGSEDTWVDGDGTELKPTHLRSHAVVFRVVGRRGVGVFLLMGEPGGSSSTPAP